MATTPKKAIIIVFIIAELILKKITIFYQGPKTSNSLPVTVTFVTSSPSFKKKLLERLVK